MVDRKKIAALMKAQNMRVSDIARSSGLSTGHICDILSGRKKRLQAVTMYRLAQALGVSVEALIDTRAREESDAVASR